MCLYHLFLHCVTSVRGQDHSGTYMFIEWCTVHVVDDVKHLVVKCLAL